MCGFPPHLLFVFPPASLFPVGPVYVHLSSPLTLDQIRQRNPLVTPGGRYRPPDCEPRHHTAIVVPYRNRQSHLRTLLYHLHPFLQRQQIHYSIYVIQQVKSLRNHVMITSHVSLFACYPLAVFFLLTLKFIITWTVMIHRSHCVLCIHSNDITVTYIVRKVDRKWKERKKR